MIKNAIQLQVTKEQIKKLKEVRKLSANTTVKMPKEIYKAMLAGIDSQIEELKSEVKEYNKRK
ncbi:MAG: hypothetical protein DRN81_06355 [Thermoproteota archaeon]|nr:MAG: hypothetical protein DRN81_06355 [Candidatus Korarchaeota archaeon]